jgi:integrase/recombinase XerD
MFETLFHKRLAPEPIIEPPAAPKTLQQVSDAFMFSRQVQRFSDRTLEDYGLTLRRFSAFIGPGTDFKTINVQQVRDFMAGLDHLSNKSLLNVHTALSSLWTWAVAEGLAGEHLLRRIRRPKAEQMATQIFTQDEIKKLLATASAGPFKERDRAILLILVDTGIRASEIAGLTIGDLQPTQLRVMGKGSKQRLVPMSRRTMTALIDYLATRGGKLPVVQPLFLTSEGNGLTRYALGKIIKRLGEKGGVQDAHPHRFRHTFAVNYLRNGGSSIALQDALGHSTVEMSSHYAHLAEVDLVDIHKIVSPVENWRL